MMNFEFFKLYFETVNSIIVERDNTITSIFEAMNFPEYGWFQGIFMTDKFGGNAVVIKFYGGQWFYNDKEVSEEYLYKCISDIHRDVKALYNERDMEQLNEFINSQY